MIVLQNDTLRVQIRQKGAELASLLDLRNSTEHLWQADPAGWGWHAPVLFPVVGRCLDDEIIWQEKKYPMPKHGFARHSLFTYEGGNNEQATFTLRDNIETRKHYPFAFKFTIRYNLEANQLITCYEIENTENEILPFSLGAHPAFRLPCTTGAEYDGSRILFPEEESAPRHLINHHGFFDGRTQPVIINNTLPITRNLFNEDAVIFKSLKSEYVTLEDSTGRKQIIIHFKGFPYLGFWCKPGADFLCIEPWLGCADTEGKKRSLEAKEGIIQLRKNELFTAEMSILLPEHS